MTENMVRNLQLESAPAEQECRPEAAEVSALASPRDAARKLAASLAWLPGTASSTTFSQRCAQAEVAFAPVFAALGAGVNSVPKPLRTIADNLIKEKNDALKTSTIVGKWRVQEGKERRRAPQILEIIQRNAGLEWGWTSSEDFVRDIKPKIVALIKERKAALQPQQGHLTRDELISAIRDLGVEERKELLQAKGVPTLNSEPEPGLRSYKKGYLNTLSVQVLSDECHNLGIEINSETTKKQMIDLIVEFKAKLPEETALPTEVTEAATTA